MAVGGADPCFLNGSLLPRCELSSTHNTARRQDDIWYARSDVQQNFNAF